MDPSVITMIFSLITPLILQWVKSSPWVPFINNNSGTINRIISIITALGNTVGVSFAYDGAAKTLLISGWDLTNVLVLGITALMAWIVQQLLYRQTIEPNARQ